MKKLTSLLLILLISVSAFSQNASIKEYSMVIPTYAFSDPDPVPRPGRIYPYFRFDGYSNTAVDKEWKIIELENDWIRVLIAPEIGGKILGAIEKSTGNEFLYLNKVIKFRDVAMRGAWTSGGIEFNFGSIGHAPSTSSPVDYLIKNNPDGSVSCFLGTMDLTSRTEWRVEVRLPADKAWFETHASWYNPTDFSTSKYQWMNAAADATDDLTYYWPGTHYIGHPGDVHAWPIMADGRDISQYAQNDYGTYHSYHVMGEIKDYYAGYYHKKDFGFGHLSDYAIKPGKKIWIWGLSRQGQIWVDLLTDPDKGNGQYTEIQTGILFNQAATESTKTPYKHLDFKSKEVERFTELWFPIKGTGGVMDVNEFGTINLVSSFQFPVSSGSGLPSPSTLSTLNTPSTSSLELRFCALQDIKDSITVIVDDSLAFSFFADLKPMQTKKFPVSSFQFPETMPKTGIIFRIQSLESPSDQRERDLTSELNERQSDRPRTSDKFDWSSLQGKYYSALEDARQRYYEKALSGFYSCLEEDPNFIPALIGAAEESMRIMKYDNAENLLKRALSIDTYQPQANYLYGIVKKKKGEYYRALEAFGLSTRTMEHRSAAFAQLAEVAFLQQDYKKALEYAQSSLDYNRFNISAYQLRILALRFAGSMSEAVEAIQQLLELDPLNHMAAYERYLVQGQAIDPAKFISGIQTEMPEQVFIELALFYYNLGLEGDALVLLDLAPEGVIVSYLRAYILGQESRKDEGEKHVEQRHASAFIAELESPDFVFPYRQEMYPVFEWAEAINPSWVNRYFMGLMNWNFGQMDEARKLFRSCGDEPELAGFYLARTKLFDGVDTELVVHDLERALKVNPDEWRVYQYFFDFYMKHSAYPQALEIIRKGARRFPDHFVTQANLAKAELYNQHYKKCLSILEDLDILPAEGAREGHDIYRQAHLLQAVDEFKNGKADAALEHIRMAREWPENLGVGKPYVTDERVEDYLQGIILMAEDQDDQAAEAFRKVLQYTEEHKPSWDSPYLLLAYSLQILGRGDQAVQVLGDWTKARMKDPITHWAAAMYANKPDQAQRALSSYQDVGGAMAWSPVGADGQFRVVWEIVNQLRLR